MTAIYANFRPSSGPAATGVWSYNDFVDQLAVGTLSANLNDDTNTPTGVSVSISGNAFTGETGGSGNATADSGAFPELILEHFNYFAVASPVDLVFAGLPANTSVTFTAAGWGNQTGRNTTFGIGGTTALYDASAGSPAAVPAPVSVSGTTDGSGNLTVNLTGNSAYGYINGFILEYTAGGLTIDSTDASMQRNTNFQVVCSTPSTAPTTGNTTLTNGNDTLIPSSVTGSDPYTLTFPVGDLSKQVDATGYDWTLEITP